MHVIDVGLSTQNIPEEGSHRQTLPSSQDSGPDGGELHESLSDQSFEPDVDLSIPITTSNDQSLLDDCYRFVLQLEGRGNFSQSATQYAIENAFSLIGRVHEPLVDAITDMQRRQSYDMDILLRIIRQSSTALTALATTHQRHNVFQQNGWVRAKPITVGNRVDSVVLHGRTVQKSVPVVYQYVPLIQTIKHILSNEKIKSLIRQSKPAQNGKLYSFIDGSKFSPVDSDLHLSLSLYCDDIEIANPLGPNSGIHKLAMYYFSVLNLPQELLSSIAHIHLVAVAMTQDVKLVGHNAILSQFVADLKTLQAGVIVDGEIVKATLAVVCADNLAANSLLNMNESFVAEYCCRFCTSGKAELQQHCTPPADALLRTKQVQLDAATSCQLGVKGICVLDELEHYSVENFSPDVMHDLLEGVCRKDLSCILLSLISLKYFSLDYLNEAINSFNYSYAERSSRPKPIAKPASGKLSIKESASMMLMLMRILPLLVAHQIPEDNEHWRLFRLLREIVDISLSPVLSVDVSYYVEQLVTEHHALFLQLYPEQHLTPKYHFLLHYGEAIRRCGPLRSMWCMRFESKHQLAKKVGDLSNNFKNIALTVATQYTVTSFSTWELDKIWPVTAVGNVRDGKVSWLEFRGVLFRPNCVIHHGLIDDKPLLSLVHSISCKNSQFVFHCQELLVEDFHEHYCAYPVTKTSVDVDVTISKLKCTQPLFIHTCMDQMFVFLLFTFGTAFNGTTMY